VPAGVKSAAVTVGADDALFEEILRHFSLDLIQLHGKEPPQRAADFKARWKKPVIRAFPINSAAAFDAVKAHEGAADYFDAAPPKGAVLPGGNAASFDWKPLQGQSFAKPWFLAGGLNAKNLREAVTLSGALRVDFSSGVERTPGVFERAERESGRFSYAYPNYFRSSGLAAQVPTDLLATMEV